MDRSKMVKAAWYLNKFRYFLTKSPYRWLYRILSVILFVSPVIILALFSQANLNRQMTESTYMKKKALAELSATIIGEKLSGILNLGISFAMRPLVIEYIKKGKWEDAVSVVSSAVMTFPFIERMIFYNPEGVIKGDVPHALPSVIGENRKDREWYTSVTSLKRPYISGVYIRGAEPKFPLISIAVPIHAAPLSSGPDQAIVSGGEGMIGILQIQIKLEMFSEWIREVDLEPGIIFYIVDQFGHLVYHPGYDLSEKVIDFSSVGIVSKLMKGIGGVELNYNAIEKETRIAAYEKIPLHGWGVVVTQRADQAFSEKNSQLKQLAIVYGLFSLLSCIMGILIVYGVIINERSEDKLQESEFRYRTVAEYTSDWEYWIMPDDTFRFISPSCQRVSGYTPEEFMADRQLLKRMMHPEDLTVYIRHLEIPSSTTGEHEPLDLRILHKDGQYRWISHVCRPVYDSAGKVNGRRASNRDITKRKLLEVELAERNRELEKSNKELDDFAYIASHDLREPLRGIANYSSFLMEDYGDKFDADGRSKLETLLRLSRHQDQLIQALLEYSRVGRVTPTYERVDLNQVIAGITESVTAGFHSVDVEIRVPSPLPDVACDRMLVEKVFLNLITNALKYNEKERRIIEIGCTPVLPSGSGEAAGEMDTVNSEGQHQIFYVRDNGIGMKEEHIGKIFTIFKRLHTRDKYGGGTGIGLTIVKKIVELHHGTIWVKSEIGDGTTFYFTLKGGSQWV